MEEIDLAIEDVTKKGRGLAKSPRGPVEVIGAYPGDRVRARLRKKRKKVFQSELLEILEPAPVRVPAKCRHCPTCGGCTFQHVDYKEQLRRKEEGIRALFGQSAPILGMETPWHYRNKMEYTFSEDRHGNKYLGLIEAGTRGIVQNLDECYLTPPWFVEARRRVYTFWQETNLSAFNGRDGTLRTLTLREGKRTGEKMAILTVSGPLRQNHIAALKEALPDLSLYIRIQVAIAGRPTQFFEHHLAGPKLIHEEMTISGKHYRFAISPTAFFQPNTTQAEKLYESALACVPNPGLTFDLYCGTGTLGMVFAPQATQVIGVEINPYAVFDGRANLEANQIDNMVLFQGDVKEIVATLGDRPDTLILDPPRAGLDKGALAQVRALAPKNIVYISCNPTTQADNIAALEGYTIQTVQPVDQFPHTPHVENIISLTHC